MHLSSPDLRVPTSHFAPHVSEQSSQLVTPPADPTPTPSTFTATMKIYKNASPLSNRSTSENASNNSSQSNERTTLTQSRPTTTKQDGKRSGRMLYWLHAPVISFKSSPKSYHFPLNELLPSELPMPTVLKSLSFSSPITTTTLIATVTLV